MAKLNEWEKETIQVRDEIRKMEDEVFQGDIKNVVKQFPQDVQDMFYKKAEERTTYEQQLVELINRQVRHKWVQDEMGQKLRRTRN